MHYTVTRPPNLLTHARHKPGVVVELHVMTADPLPSDIYQRVERAATAIDLLFDAIPEPDDGDAS
jgi:hypothetical protein